MYSHGFIKVAAASPVIKTGNPKANAEEILKVLVDMKQKQVDFVVFPELTLSGQCANDLYYQDYLYQECLDSLEYILENNDYKGVAIIGSFFVVEDRIINCAVVIQDNEILGIVPKSYICNNKSNNQSRWFMSSNSLEWNQIELFGNVYPFTNTIFYNEDNNVSFSCEISDDLCSPLPQNEIIYLNGATIVFNLGSGVESIGACDERRDYIKACTKKYNGAYVYSGNNTSESTSECIFSNHKVIAENGIIVKECDELSLESNYIIADIDINKLHYLRKTNGWIEEFSDRCEAEFEYIEYSLEEVEEFEFEEKIDLLPFVLKSEKEFQRIIDMQAASVMQRLNYIGINKVVIGVSGGLDSTLALLSLCHMCDKFNISRKNIIALTLPTSNNSSTTYNNSLELMKRLNVEWKEINIKEHVNAQLKEIGHDMETKDVTYENVQARYRTFTLMNTANLVGGIVIGTSDMSEVALGWSTFNGDQMAMYGMNSGLPKTAIKAVTAYYKSIYPEVSDILDSILDTPISPELSGNDQKTEDIIGKYEINDFILHRFLSVGDSDERIIYLLNKFMNLTLEEAKEYVNNFHNRFFHQQYKRLTMPEGVKIFDLSLSPRSELKLSGDIHKIKK